MSFTDAVEAVGKGVDAAGVVLMIGGVLVATTLAVSRRAGHGSGALRLYRRRLVPELSLEVELTGRWPWQKEPEANR